MNKGISKAPADRQRLRTTATEETLDDAAVLSKRQSLIFLPHVAVLNRWVERAAALPLQLPYFDPLDGGDTAPILILLEAPARHAMRPRFVSRDNPGPSQKNLKQFLQVAGLERHETIIWNIIPWLPPCDRKPDRPRIADVRRGITLLLEVIFLLPHLRGIVFSGRTAQLAQPSVQHHRPDLFQVQMPHPSPLSVCGGKDVSKKIIAALQSAKSLSR